MDLDVAVVEKALGFGLFYCYAAVAITMAAVVEKVLGFGLYCCCAAATEIIS